MATVRLERRQVEVPCTIKGRPSYRWRNAWGVVDVGTNLDLMFPWALTKTEAREFIKDRGHKEEKWKVAKFIGLKCDRPGCGYKDMSITRSQYPSMVDAPCPKCGAPLLTKADMEAVLILEAVDGKGQIPDDQVGVIKNTNVTLDGTGIDGLRINGLGVKDLEKK